MRAALLENYGQPLLVVDDVDIEPPHHGEVQVRIAHCGVCHSDLSVVDGALTGTRAERCSVTRLPVSSRRSAPECHDAGAR